MTRSKTKIAISLDPEVLQLLDQKVRKIKAGNPVLRRSWRARHAVEAACRSSLRGGWEREHRLERAGVLWLREAS